MTRALLVVDVQNDFTEGGALAVEGGAAVAAAISAYLRDHPDRYGLIVASRDWHDGGNDNGGHFADAEPDFVDTWPVHCVAGTPGADYHPAFEDAAVHVHVRKGQGRPAYSAYEGLADDGRPLTEVLREAGILDLDVVGIATDYCVRASAIDAQRDGVHVRVLVDLTAGVAPASSAAALREFRDAGIEVLESSEVADTAPADRAP